MSDLFNKIIEFTLQNEGGYVNDPKDPGGETKFGISKRSYPNLDIKNLTRDEAIAIYKHDFWDKYKFDQIKDFSICRKLFDMSVNMGYSQAIKILQRVLHVTCDGILGPLTLSTINSDEAALLLGQYTHALSDFYKSLVEKNPNNAKFLKGWMRRVDE